MKYKVPLIFLVIFLQLHKPPSGLYREVKMSIIHPEVCSSIRDQRFPFLSQEIKREESFWVSCLTKAAEQWLWPKAVFLFLYSKDLSQHLSNHSIEYCNRLFWKRIKNFPYLFYDKNSVQYSTRNCFSSFLEKFTPCKRGVIWHGGNMFSG